MKVEAEGRRWVGGGGGVSDTHPLKSDNVILQALHPALVLPRHIRAPSRGGLASRGGLKRVLHVLLHIVNQAVEAVALDVQLSRRLPRLSHLSGKREGVGYPRGEVSGGA